MCYSPSRVHKTTAWNWDGERVVEDPIVPSSRPPVGSPVGSYEIDVRQFLTSEHNVVMRHTLEHHIRPFVMNLQGGKWELFSSRQPGAFDYRAHVITEFVSREIQYRRIQTSGLDPWQFPEETLSLRSGDCEDRALLIASLLFAAGITSFNVRVALGKFRAWTDDEHQDFDHVWVMYKNEAGHWEIIEPAQAGKVQPGPAPGMKMPDTAEYIPFFLFNDVHLWQVQHSSAYKEQTAMDLNRDWSSLHPEFAGWVHKSILTEALTPLMPEVCPPWVMTALNQHFTSVLGRKAWTVDDPDMPGAYDPLEHFDNGYIDESWKRVNERLQEFRNSSVTKLDAFHLAAHAIADFYAHSSYGQFGAVTNGQLELYDPDNPRFRLPSGPDYSPGTTFDFQRFSRNAEISKGTAADALNAWQGKIISGRYGQTDDSHDILEQISFIPPELRKGSDFPTRGLLPHHNEIAVDEDKPRKQHFLYDSRTYAEQYKLRYDAAARHIGEAFRKNWNP